MTAPSLTKTRDNSGTYPQGYAVGSDDHTDLNNLRTELNAHEAASAPHSGHAPIASPSFTGTANFESMTAENHRFFVENVFYGDAGTEPTPGAYTLAISAVNYYVPYISFAQNNELVIKFAVPLQYKAGQQIKLRLGYASAGSGVAYVWSSYFGLVDDGDVIDTSINTATDTGRTITSPVAANEAEYDETILVTSSTGTMNSVPVAAGDVIIGKIKRTDADANPFLLFSIEVCW